MEEPNLYDLIEQLLIEKQRLKEELKNFKKTK